MSESTTAVAFGIGSYSVGTYLVSTYKLPVFHFFRVGRAGQWRDALTADQIKSIIAAHAPVMMRFGYLEAVI